MKTILASVITVVSAQIVGAPPKAPVLLAPQIMSPTEIHWRFQNRDPQAVAFELWNTISRSLILRVDDPKATYISEDNVVPADPDMACGRYVVAVEKDGRRSFGQIMTYPCVRTPPVPLPPPRVEILDQKVIKVTTSSGANDPATGIGIYEAQRGNWVSPANMFVANPEILTPGEWGADLGTTIIGLRPNSSYTFLSQARSVTGEVTKFSAPTVFRMPAEKGDAYAPSLASIGTTGGLLGQSLIQTFVTKSQRPAISGLVNGAAVTVDLDDHPYLAPLSGSGQVKNFSFTPSSKIGTGYHYLRLGAHRDGTIAWTPTIEFLVK